MGVLDALLEGFQPDAGPQVLDGRLRPGDRVRVKTKAKGTDALVGRLVRQSDAKPDTHAIVAPEGGGAHVEAPVKSIELDTPERRAREIASSLEPGEGAVPSVKGGKVTVRRGPGGVVAGRQVQEGVLDRLLENFNPAEPRGFHGRWVGLPGRQELHILDRAVHIGTLSRALPRTEPASGAFDLSYRGKPIGTGGVHDGIRSILHAHGVDSRGSSLIAGDIERNATRDTRAEILAKSPNAQRELDEYQGIARSARADAVNAAALARQARADRLAYSARQSVPSRFSTRAARMSAVTLSDPRQGGVGILEGFAVVGRP